MYSVLEDCFEREFTRGRGLPTDYMSLARLVLEYLVPSCRTITQSDELIIKEFNDTYLDCFIGYNRPRNSLELDRHLPVSLRPDTIRGDRMRYSTRYATRAFQALNEYKNLSSAVRQVCEHIQTSCRGLKPERNTPLEGEIYCFAEHYADLTAKIGDHVALLEGEEPEHPILTKVREEWEEMLFEGGW